MILCPAPFNRSNLNLKYQSSPTLSKYWLFVEKITDIFNYIYLLAENAHSEIYPRYFWKDYAKEEKPCKYVFVVERPATTRCAITDIGLSVAL